MVFHGYSITHVDTPGHYFWQGKMYNGRSANLITSREGAQVESVDLRQRQPRRAGAGVRGAPALGVPAHDRTAPAPAHHGLAGEPDRAVLSGRPAD